LLFLFVPGDRESGAVYVLDRKHGVWYASDFEDEQFGGYSVTQFDALLKGLQIPSILLSGPGLRRTGLPWEVIQGTVSERPPERPFDRKNIPGYLPAPTLEGHVEKGSKRSKASVGRRR